MSSGRASTARRAARLIKNFKLFPNATRSPIMTTVKQFFHRILSRTVAIAAAIARERTGKFDPSTCRDRTALRTPIRPKPAKTTPDRRQGALLLPLSGREKTRRGRSRVRHHRWKTTLKILTLELPTHRDSPQ